MKTLVPNPGIESFRKELDRFFDRLWEGDWKEPTLLGEWSPALDLVETKDLVTVRMDVPGLEPGDLHLNLQEHTLTIRGEKRVEREDKTETRYRSERQFGQFTRIVRLPSSVNPDKVNATFRNGVLTVTMPKLPEAKGTEIPIKVA